MNIDITDTDVCEEKFPGFLRELIHTVFSYAAKRYLVNFEYMRFGNRLQEIMVIEGPKYYDKESNVAVLFTLSTQRPLFLADFTEEEVVNTMKLEIEKACLYTDGDMPDEILDLLISMKKEGGIENIGLDEKLY